jgi:hypothetical protein
MLHSSQVDYVLPPQGDKQLEGLVSAGSEVGWSPIACRSCSAPLGVKEIPPIVQGEPSRPIVLPPLSACMHLTSSVHARRARQLAVVHVSRHEPFAINRKELLQVRLVWAVWRVSADEGVLDVLLTPLSVCRADTLEHFVAKHLLASSSIHAVYRFVIKAFESVRLREPMDYCSI